jgi:hypothetical protein
LPNHQFKQNKLDEYYTKRYAILPLLNYLPKGATIWCPFDKEESKYVQVFTEFGYVVLYSHIDYGQDFFTYEPEEYNYIISNPPYSLREKILERLFSLKKPFAMLINDAGLFDSKKRFQLLSENNFEMMIFDGRIDYEKDGIGLSGVPFKSIYLCSGFLPKRFVFEKLIR